MGLPVFVFALVVSVAAQSPPFHVVKPSTTGIPGEELRVMKFDPQGNLWVAGRAPFFAESGVAMLPADQVPFEQLSGGGFDTGAWHVWSSVQNPILTPFISGMEFGADGTVWLGTGSIDLGGGLIRFRPDAVTPEEMWFKYDSDNSPLLLDGIRALDMAPDGRLWMVNGEVNQSPAVFSFDPATGAWQEFDMGQELPWPSSFQLVNSVHAGLSGHVWVSHASLPGLAEFDGTTWTLHAGGTQFDAMLEDLQGNVWLTTPLAGLWKWNGTSYQHWAQLGGTGTTTGLGMDASGLVYAGTWYGPVYRMVGGSTPVLFADANALPYHIQPRPNGDVWIGNYGGNGVPGTARHFTANGTELEAINTWNSGLPDDFVDSILGDTAGNVWFATGEAGLSRMLGHDGAAGHPTHWRNWGDHNDGAEPYPWAGNEPMSSMLDTGNGTIWMGGNGVGRWDVASGSFTGFWNWQTSSLGVDPVNDIARDANGDIWIGTGGSGAFRYDAATDSWKQHAFSSPYSYTQERIFSLATDHDGLMWVGAEYGLHTFDGTTWTDLTMQVPFDAFSVREIEVAPDGDVWLCTQEGLAHWDGVAWTFFTPDNSGLIAAGVNDVDIRADGLVAVSSFGFPPSVGGVNTFDGTTWVSYTTANSPLTHFQCESVHFDADGDLWVSPMSTGVNEISIGKTPGAGTWSDLGLGSSGGNGHHPHLAGTGTLLAGDAAALSLAKAAPSAPAWLIGGTKVVELPLKGGLLVPQPEFVLALHTTANGDLSLPFTWPAGVPPGTQLALQAWIADGGAAHGFAASNGLLATAP